MVTPRLVIGYLYPEIMRTYGDHGNVETLVQRCTWRGIGADVAELRAGDQVGPGTADLLIIGSGSESAQRLIAPDLAIGKGAGIRDAVAAGAAVLTVGTGYELFGRYCQPAEGAELPGVGLFDTWTVREAAEPSRHEGTIADARAERFIGDLVVAWNGELLVGFENHSGKTYLGPAARPLGTVLAGHGNNGDGFEGAQLPGAVGTYLRGPCLPRNPALADHLIRAALRRRYPGLELGPLTDGLETAAREAAFQRLGEPGGACRQPRTAPASRCPQAARRPGRRFRWRCPAGAGGMLPGAGRHGSASDGDGLPLPPFTSQEL
jgi:CobQ-like glutamine amidotransferase family enzyme